MRDLLSPPPHTAKDYSMGALSACVIPKNHGLLENRGYKIFTYETKMDESKILIPYKVQLDTLIKLIQNQSVRFFQLQAIEEPQ